MKAMKVKCKLVDFGKLNVNAFKAFQYNLLGM